LQSEHVSNFLSLAHTEMSQKTLPSAFAFSVAFEQPKHLFVLYMMQLPQ